MKCAASLSTSSSGVAVRCLLFRQRTQASVARAVVIQRKKTACHKVNSDARYVGYTANADVNGARNILAAGHAVLACGEMVQSGRPLKQEPTEMIQATA